MSETITWIPVAERLPDSDLTVLVSAPACSEPIWLGYHDGSEWLSAESAQIDVTHWADMPKGPAA